MSGKGLKIALGVSVVLNVFLLAGGATFMATNRYADKNAAESQTPKLSVPAVELIETRSPEVAEKVLTDLRAVALTARDDFHEARTSRRAAIDMTASDNFNAATVSALLERSRASEIRGRGRLEAGAVEVLARLDAEDRKALAPLLSRKRPRNGDAPATETAAKPAEPAAKAS